MEISAKSGERLVFKNIDLEDGYCAGFRHEFPDELNRVWRTDCVATVNKSSLANVRVRGQCVSRGSTATTITPKKPYLIKLMLKNGWTAMESPIPVTDTPIEYSSELAPTLASVILRGENIELPMVYVSCIEDKDYLLDCEKLAYDLGGIAHVVREGNRSNSFEMMALSGQRNPYGGTIGICQPQRGLIKKLFRRFDTDTPTKLSSAILATCSSINDSRVDYSVLDWASLQEQHSKALRQRMGSSASDSVDEYINAFQSELDAKDEKITGLEDKIARLEQIQDEEKFTDDGIVPAELAEKSAEELYPGEVGDRVREVLIQYINDSGFSVHPRTKAVAEGLIANTDFSGRSVGLTQQIKAAGKDSASMSSQLGQLLVGFGYTRGPEGKHQKYSPPPNSGLEIEVLPKTPSDYRAGRNKAAEIIERFGLKQVR